MDLVSMVRERVAAAPNHHFDISGGFGGSKVGEIENLNVLPHSKNGNLKEVE
jgi:hypothetical protein